jgi:catechol 2,3-dioxygenase-like lactoylglutathione lyase family enzyme
MAAKSLSLSEGRARLIARHLSSRSSAVGLLHAVTTHHEGKNAMANGTQTRTEQATKTARAVEEKLEVVVIPVSDVERAKRFYQGLGWRLDADFALPDGFRGVQVTPPGSPCSIIFGKGVTPTAPGSAQGLFLVVDVIAAARADLIAKGVEVSEVFHFQGGIHVSGTNERQPGPDPQGQSYRTWASFQDPDGNGWLLQEVKQRLPGRGLSNLDVPNLTALLREAEQLHGGYDPTAPKHHWSTFYASYIVARERGQSPDEAAKEAARAVETSIH